LAATPDGMEQLDRLLGALDHELLGKGLPSGRAMELLIRTHLIEAPSELAAQTERLLAARLSLPPAVASLFRAQLVDRLGEMAGRQRRTTLRTARRFLRADL